MLMEDADLCIRMHLAGPSCALDVSKGAAPCSSCRELPGGSSVEPANGSERCKPCDCQPLLADCRQPEHCMCGNSNGSSSSSSSSNRCRPQSGPGRRCWGRVVQVDEPPAYTSGRRMAALGNVRTTLVHFLLGLGWLSGASPGLLRWAVSKLYSDKHR